MFLLILIETRYGQLSGMVEPIAGIFGAFAVLVGIKTTLMKQITIPCSQKIQLIILFYFFTFAAC